ncbi:hypothetical protein, partial [Salmonella sp. s59944]|uniref:hypothetical protein n=1 Tax=Salmonella sp. s59944 TaxID=3159720 RepID=UPI00397F89C3
MERLYGKSLDDIGPKWGAGITERNGTVVAMTSAFGWLFVVVDAGSSGVSSIMVWDGLGWH